MKCPIDDVPLETITVQGVDVQTCRICGGMFLDKGELNRVAEPTTGDLEFSTVDLDSFDHADEHGPLNCPRDGTEMKKVEFVIHTNIILDYCQSCGGFWLDGRELTRINEEVGDMNAAAREIPDPPMVRLARFFWELPFPH